MTRPLAFSKAGIALPLQRRRRAGITSAPRPGKALALPSAADGPIGPEMDLSDLRVAIFSGNYNYVRDGANQALNRLAGYLLRKGAKGTHLVRLT